MEAVERIHHISAIVGNPNENVAFYRDVLGLRLIKQTVNFDDPGVYHLYFSNQDVAPGTVITFFPWPNDNYGWKGSGQVGRIAFRVPLGSLDYWEEYLISQNIEVIKTRLFSQDTLEFKDVHGLELAIVESNQVANSKKILGFHGTVLLSGNSKATKELLINVMGLKELENDEKNFRFETNGKEKHHIIVPILSKPPGRFGIGTAHHVAWSVPDMERLEGWKSTLREKGYGATSITDREYFKSVYVREKGRVVLEFATEGPGFEIDEERELLGTSLKLPEKYEKNRLEYEKKLPPLDIF